MKKIFVFDIEIFNSEILICVGTKSKDMKKWADKNSKALKEILKQEENCKLVDNLADTSAGFVKVFSKDNVNFYMLWLKDFKNEWGKLDVLNHEVIHLRQFLFEYRSIQNEIEFEAYFTESTFRELRIKLIKYLK